MANIIVKEAGKPSRPMEVPEGAQLGNFLTNALVLDTTGKTITVNGSSVSLTYLLQDGDRVQITKNNAGA